MVTMNNSLVKLLHGQQQTQNDTTWPLQAVEQSKKDHANDSLIDDIPNFDGKPKLYFDWILKKENMAAVSKWDPKELALGKA